MEFLKLTPEQITGAERIASTPVFYLADLPGFGKTAQLVHGFDLAGATSGLIVCPPILRDNIAREFERWSIFKPPVHVIRSGKDEVPADGVIAISYNLAAEPAMQKKLAERGGQVLACDEAHALKSVGAKRAKAILGARGVARSFDRMVWMSGTPAPNHAGELYTFAKAAGVWHGNQSAFMSEFCLTVDTPFGPKILGNRNADGLKRLLAPVMLRRSINEGLPPLRTGTLPIAGDIRAILAEADPDIIAHLEAAAEAGDWQFLQTPFVSTVRKLCGLAKAPGVAQLVLNELEAGEPKVLVFCQHTAVIETIAEAVKGAGHSFGILSGATAPVKRQPIIDEFQGGSLRVLIAQIQAASEGLTFTACRRVILAEPSWTPKDNEQAIKRCWRRGQMQPVEASFVTLANSIDDRILRTLERKNNMLGELLG